MYFKDLPSKVGTCIIFLCIYHVSFCIRVYFYIKNKKRDGYFQPLVESILMKKYSLFLAIFSILRGKI